MTDSIAYDKAIPALLAAIPEFSDDYQALQDGGISTDLPHPIMATFSEFVVARLLSNDSDELLRRVFEFLELLATSRDLKTRSLLQVSFLEHLPKTPGALEAARLRMGPETRRLSDEMEALWSDGTMPPSWRESRDG